MSYRESSSRAAAESAVPTVTGASPWQSGRWVTRGALVLAVLLVAVVAGIVAVQLAAISSASAMREEAAESIMLSELQASLNAAAVASAYLANENHPGNSSPADGSSHADDAVEQLFAALDDFEQAVSRLGSLYHGGEHAWLDEVSRGLEEYRENIRSFVDLRSGDSLALDAMYHGVIVPAERTLDNLLIEERREENAHVEAAVADSLAAERASRVAIPSLSAIALLVLAGLFWLLNERRRRETDALRAMGEEKDRFIGTVSHELRTPLTAVVGFIDLLRAEPDSSENAEMLALAAQEAAELANLVEDLLVFAQTEAGTIRMAVVPVDLRAQAAQVLESLDRRPAVPLHRGDSLPPVAADPARVRQILRNLLTNAQRYGGEHVELQLNATEDTVSIAVIDDGPGIPDGYEERVFEAYERAHTHRGRSDSVGLGLAVSRSLALCMGGDLSYERQEGMTEFELSLPVWPCDREALRPAAPAPAGPSQA